MKLCPEKRFKALHLNPYFACQTGSAPWTQPAELREYYALVSLQQVATLSYISTIPFNGDAFHTWILFKARLC